MDPWRCRYVSRTLPPAGRVTEGTRIQLCGRLSVEIAGVQLAQALRGKQVRLLLAYLVLNRSRHVGREELIDVLWPHQAPRSEDAAFRTLLSRLRSAVGTSSVAGRDELILDLPEPVWVDLEGDLVLVNTARGRQKDKNMRRDPRVAMAVIDPENPYRYLEIRGRIAEITEEGADAHIDKMAKKYLGADKYPYRQPSETRVIFKIQPERVNTMG